MTQSAFGTNICTDIQCVFDQQTPHQHSCALCAGRGSSGIYGGFGQQHFGWPAGLNKRWVRAFPRLLALSSIRLSQHNTAAVSAAKVIKQLAVQECQSCSRCCANRALSSASSKASPLGMIASCQPSTAYPAIRQLPCFMDSWLIQTGPRQHGTCAELHASASEPRTDAQLWHG